MTVDQLLILIILSVTITLFIWGRWRHDMVALAALLVCVFVGLIPPQNAFIGFGHPAVVTIACVLILSRGLQNTGAMDALALRVVRKSGNTSIAILLLTGLGAFLSSFMNNVGALALLMPVAADMAEKQNLALGKILMPLSFGTILGGMTTLIGTPPNLVVSGFRADAGAGSYGMFDFTPVGLAVAVVGVIFIALVGWRLVPARNRVSASSFETGTYLTEALVEEKSTAAGKKLRDITKLLETEDAQVVGVVHNDARVSPATPWQIVRSGDILVIEAEPESLATCLSNLGLKMMGAPGTGQLGTRQRDGGESLASWQGSRKKDTGSGPADREEMQLRELVIMPDSALVGRSVRFSRLAARYQIQLLALSRQGRRSVRRLRLTPLLAGDALLMMGADDNLNSFAREQGCVPLAPRHISMPNKEKAAIALVSMIIAVAGAAFGLLPAAISFATCVLAFMALKIVPLRNVYESVDGSVVVLLGTLIAVADVMETTGAADLAAQLLLDVLAQGSAVFALGLILIITMTLSDFMNNVATAAVMCSIAMSTAEQLAVNPDSFLMAVAIGASCAFLTPVGHQNNTLILGPGGFNFGDYWKMGLPLELLVLLVSIPMLLWVWPL
ncbi:SLC13 family permease [Microbulbifer sp. OS29]|uniref:SLC13 family permease n=1 Tax=Microbulbifer okhotskensis TaxID=2926617 RepID=A0A9X2ES69_9GAMM|nr:SLC13 family permease [Microbulbifer okhotskensis]MCO1334623.1 SLC13 family permease [Microbulbifer okhotskensis]